MNATLKYAIADNNFSSLGMVGAFASSGVSGMVVVSSMILLF